jgi:AraC-like DNA-binding protein
MKRQEIEFINGLHVRLALPAEPLRPYITAYYTTHIESETPISDWLYPEWGNVRMIYEGGFECYRVGVEPYRAEFPLIQGPTTKPIHVSTGHVRVVGIGLLPSAFSHMFGVDVDHYADAYVPVRDLLGSGGDDLAKALAAVDGDDDAQFALCDTFFLNLIAGKAERPRTALVHALHKLLNDPDINTAQEIGDALGLGTARLNRLCKQGFGFSPKLLLRRQRFLRMLGALHSRPYTEWRDFADPSYVDQSHLIREFKYFMGLSPSQYLALPRPIQLAAVPKRAEVIGRPLQGLHKMGEKD